MTIATTLPILALGDTGSDVQWAQYLLVLKTLNYDLVDGVFGPLTARAVRGTQAMAHVDVDGVVGLQTWALSVHAAGATLASLCGVTAPQP